MQHFENLAKQINWELLQNQRELLISHNFMHPCTCSKQLEGISTLLDEMISLALSTGLVSVDEENNLVNTETIKLPINDPTILIDT